VNDEKCHKNTLSDDEIIDALGAEKDDVVSIQDTSLNPLNLIALASIAR